MTMLGELFGPRQRSDSTCFGSDPLWELVAIREGRMHVGHDPWVACQTGAKTAKLAPNHLFLFVFLHLKTPYELAS